MYVKICKRVGTKDSEEGDRNRQKLGMIWDDWWVMKMDMYCDSIVGHFGVTKDVMESENNVACTNIRCQAIEIR
jgi:hypothetical protein